MQNTIDFYSSFIFALFEAPKKKLLSGKKICSTSTVRSELGWEEEILNALVKKLNIE